MPNPIKLFENLIYRSRDLLWEYPDLLFAKRNSLRFHFQRFYRLSIPYSHFGLSIFLIIIFSLGLLLNPISEVLGLNNAKLIEGVVMGVDSDGNLQRLNKINPVVPSNIQLEKDLIEMIYEPLIRYEFVKKDEQSWTVAVEGVLASEVIRIRQGADYQFQLRRNIKWHDGSDFTSDDVIATFETVSKLNVSNAYIKAISQLQWEKIDDYNLRVCTKSQGEEGLSCDQRLNSPIFSNFLELISIKILPKRYLADINSQTVNTAVPMLFRSPVGTGKYKFSSSSRDQVTLDVNKDYYQKDQIPEISKIEFRFFENLRDAVSAVENGEIHTLASISVEYLNEIKSYSKITIQKSSVIDSQYWGLYFNLRKNPDGKSIGPEFLQDVKVRRAISASIDRQNIINNALLGAGQEALGPIQQRSYFFNANAGWYTYNPKLAAQLLDEAGWTLKSGQKYRTNASGEELKFSLYFVDSYDRLNVAKAIKQDLESIGINSVIDRRLQTGQDTSPTAPSGWSLNELNNELLAPRSFDVLLYGMNTFIDPDRYELFHSSQQVHPGLNIAGYSGSEETVKPRENRQEGESSIVRLPKVDRLLEQTRTFDPEAAKDARKTNYDSFQELLAADAPVVFLYHPQYIYYHSKNLKNVNLEGRVSVEDRFRNISDWEIK